MKFISDLLCWVSVVAIIITIMAIIIGTITNIMVYNTIGLCSLIISIVAIMLSIQLLGDNKTTNK